MTKSERDEIRAAGRLLRKAQKEFVKRLDQLIQEVDERIEMEKLG